MPEIRMRRKHQITLPASIVRQAGIEPEDKLLVTYSNGHIVIVPKKAQGEKDDVMSYAGLFSGAWGDTNQQVAATVSELHSEWEK